jgi:peptidoglycan/LPS O-acetylase OafA/YrhL
MSAEHRSPVIDLIKAIACLTIVAHHMAFYQTIGSATTPFTGAVLDWFSQYGRMAVQVFLVLGGYLAACSLAPHGTTRWAPQTAHQPWGWLSHIARTLVRRIDRLAGPYALALVVTVLVAAVVRPYFDNPAVPQTPTLHQLAANAFMLQDILRQDALSAGLWYVAIDLQLFALTVIILATARIIGHKLSASSESTAVIGQGLLVIGTALSLWYWNRHPGIDMWAPYFLGSYGLGLMAGWAANANRPEAARGWLSFIAILGVSALAVDYRGRIAVALCTALFLAIAMRNTQIIQWRIPQQHWLMTRPLKALEKIGKMSYSVFLMHFSILLVVGVIVNSFLKHNLFSHTLANTLALSLALWIGHWMHRHVEQLPLSRWLSTAR